MGVPFDIINNISGLVTLLGVVAVGYFVIRRSDVNNIQSQLVQARADNDELRKRLDDKDRENKDFQNQINTLSNNLSKLQGQIDEKDKRIESLSQIRITQSPEMVAYMQDVRNFMNNTHQWMLTTTETLTEVSQRTRINKSLNAK